MQLVTTKKPKTQQSKANVWRIGRRCDVLPLDGGIVNESTACQ